ncbi:hypothetical protein BDB00DRAFT_810894 [Zychaea mexicana]|uniref:uncharacterized protein n=1 Tax=Zychaea mexicana TaxID=64656 RepID=UPI0022FDC0B8|nr:uncharacterized protein BDB00DRAFT_810894 [Zychaea mexicana]KAI9495906.1 hypothetical protein BDB00DRAFT_810894 [Zychaea mexicana]
MLQFAYNNKPGTKRYFKARSTSSASASHRIIPLLLGTLFLLTCLSFLSTLPEITVDPNNKTKQHSAAAAASPPPLLRNDASAEAQEQYLAYLPHSGLSNQRIELANALLLAALLQRTLIIPPAFLGTVVGWMKKEQIYDHLGWLTNASVPFEQICRPATPGDLASYVRRSRCAEYRHFGVIPWSELHNIDSLTPYVNIRFQDIVSLQQLQQDLGIDENDTYVHTDQHLYDWRLYEDLSVARNLLRTGTNYVDSFAGRRYYKVYTIKHWQRRPERLLQLGGIFGSTRINLIDPEHIALRNTIASALHYRRDTLIGETVKNIVEYLGGAGSFVGVHFRTGDKPFRKQLPKNLVLFAQGMAELTGAPVIPREEDVLAAIQSADPGLWDEPRRVPLLPPHAGLHVPPWSTVCRSVPVSGAPITSGFRTVIYIATDQPNPRSPISKLAPWFDMFPCTVTLNDLPDYLFAPLDQVHDMIVPEKTLRSFLIPVVDAMVAAHARQVFATPRSTYSKYIGEMNRAWVPS